VARHGFRIHAARQVFPRRSGWQPITQTRVSHRERTLVGWLENPVPRLRRRNHRCHRESGNWAAGGIARGSVTLGERSPAIFSLMLPVPFRIAGRRSTSHSAVTLIHCFVIAASSAVGSGVTDESLFLRITTTSENHGRRMVLAHDQRTH